MSARVKKFYPEEEDFSKEKGVCLPMAYRIFGVVPPIGRTLSAEEREAVARWLYHNFRESWEEFIRENPPLRTSRRYPLSYIILSRLRRCRHGQV